MEKKTYITPNILVRKVTPHTILAGSEESVPVSGNGSVGGNTGNLGGLSKEGNGFDWGDSWSNNEESEN